MDCEALGRLSAQLGLAQLYKQGKIAEAASALGNANAAFKCAACRSIGAPNAHQHDLAACPRLAKLPADAREQVTQHPKPYSILFPLGWRAERTSTTWPPASGWRRMRARR